MGSARHFPGGDRHTRTLSHAPQPHAPLGELYARTAYVSYTLLGARPSLAGLPGRLSREKRFSRHAYPKKLCTRARLWKMVVACAGTASGQSSKTEDRSCRLRAHVKPRAKNGGRAGWVSEQIRISEICS